MPHKADPTVICQCGAIISKYYMPKHLQTAKHIRDMAGRENIVVEFQPFQPLRQFQPFQPFQHIPTLLLFWFSLYKRAQEWQGVSITHMPRKTARTQGSDYQQVRDERDGRN